MELKKAGIFVAGGIFIIAIIILNLSKIKIQKNPTPQVEQGTQNQVEVQMQEQQQVQQEVQQQVQQEVQQEVQQQQVQQEVQQVQQEVQQQQVQQQQVQQEQAQPQQEQVQGNASVSESGLIEIDESTVSYASPEVASGYITSKQMLYNPTRNEVLYMLLINLGGVETGYYCAKSAYDAVQKGETVKCEYTRAEGIVIITKLSKS